MNAILNHIPKQIEEEEEEEPYELWYVKLTEEFPKRILLCIRRGGMAYGTHKVKWASSPVTACVTGFLATPAGAEDWSLNSFYNCSSYAVHMGDEVIMDFQTWK